jgi:hypothetical protein
MFYQASGKGEKARIEINRLSALAFHLPHSAQLGPEYLLAGLWIGLLAIPACVIIVQLRESLEKIAPTYSWLEAQTEKPA